MKLWLTEGGAFLTQFLALDRKQNTPSYKIVFT